MPSPSAYSMPRRNRTDGFVVEQPGQPTAFGQSSCARAVEHAREARVGPEIGN